jgi:hypothetical protein
MQIGNVLLERSVATWPDGHIMEMLNVSFRHQVAHSKIFPKTNAKFSARKFSRLSFVAGKKLFFTSHEYGVAYRIGFL